jgi:hypothetical protein
VDDDVCVVKDGRGVDSGSGAFKRQDFDSGSDDFEGGGVDSG